MFSNREDVAAGGLISHGSNLADVYYRTAATVVKILNGTKPADVPVEQPTIIHLAINRKTAHALGLKVVPEMLLRAHEVID